MIETTISTAKKMVRQMVQHNLAMQLAGQKVENQPIFLHSSPGIGKSSITSQVCDDMRDVLEEMGRKPCFGFADIRLGSMDCSEVQGMPHVIGHGKEDSEMRFSVPDWFPSEERVAAGLFPEFGVVFFDELSNAPIDTQHAAYRIILDRSLHGGVKMAEGWQIMAAGNLKEDKTGAKMVAPALANRFSVHIKIVPSLVDFSGYALAKGLESMIIGFLNFKSDNLYKFDPAKSNVAFATPRSWEAASHLQKVYGDDEEMLTIALAGCVGESVATDYMNFRRHQADLPDFVAIMDGKSDFVATSSMDMGLMFALTTSMMQHLIDNVGDKDRIANLDKAILSQLPDDFKVMVYKMIKSLSNEATSGKIMLSTMATFKTVAKYAKRGK